MSFWDIVKKLFGSSDIQETMQKVPIEEVQQHLEDTAQRANDAVETTKEQAVEDAKDRVDNQ